VAEPFSKEEYSVRIRWLIWSRAVVVTFLVITLLFFQKRYAIYSFHPFVLYYVLIVVYILTALYHLLLRMMKRILIFVYLQILVDILIITYLVTLTGGIDSGFSILYHVAIISASIVVYRRGGYLAASLSSILYGAMLDLQFYGLLHFTRSQNFTAGQVFYHVLISILSFYMVALLSGYLAERLRSTRQALREKSVDFEDLRALQEHILKSVGSGILTIDLQGNVTSWNPAAEFITGYDYDELRSRWQEIFGGSIKELFGHTDYLKERPYRFNGKVIKKDGNTALLGLTASLLKDEANTVRGIILTFQDITKLVELEGQMRRQERLASVGSLAAGIAHEIRNPLASLSGSIQLLKGELQLKGDEQRLMDIVVHETDRLNEIITDFLEYARPKAAHMTAIALEPLLAETILLLRNSRGFRDTIHVDCTVDPSLHVLGDAQRLRQVFWNLFINACQAMPTGGTLTVSAKLERIYNNPDRVEIIVRDTGGGVSRESLTKIFDPFYTTKNEGTGLGLAIAYRIVEDHQGTISVQSGEGSGTTFIIRIPPAEDAAADSSAVSLSTHNEAQKTVKPEDSHE
jgi:two-component system, NtrC family, sensor histidine kinase PilS